MAYTALRLSGLLLIGGAALLGAAIVILSFKPVINQVFSPRIGCCSCCHRFCCCCLFLACTLSKRMRRAGLVSWVTRCCKPVSSCSSSSPLPRSFIRPLAKPRREPGNIRAWYCPHPWFAAHRNSDHPGWSLFTMVGDSPACCDSRLFLRFLRRGVPTSPGGSDRFCFLWYFACAGSGVDRPFYLERLNAAERAAMYCLQH